MLYSCGTASGRATGITMVGEGKYTGSYWPTKSWRSCQPEEVGMDSAKLMLVYPYVANPNFSTKGVVIIRKGYIVAEDYFGGRSQDTRFPSYSVAKSFTSALIGIALGEGILQDVNDPIYNYYPELIKKGSAYSQPSGLCFTVDGSLR